MTNTNAIYSFRIKRNNETGISVQYFDKSATEGSFQISLDSSPQIVVVQIEGVTLLEKITNEEYFKRLLRDIRSPDTYTRLWAATMLCDFIEFSSDDIDFSIIIEGIEIVVAQTITEKFSDVIRHLAGSIGEYTCHLHQLDKQEEKKFAIRLAKLDSDSLYNCLDNDNYLKIPEVQAYIERTEKRWNG